eukprot:5066342-Amphidinium_carterae.1
MLITSAAVVCSLHESQQVHHDPYANRCGTPPFEVVPHQQQTELNWGLMRRAERINIAISRYL